MQNYAFEDPVTLKAIRQALIPNRVPTLSHGKAPAYWKLACALYGDVTITHEVMTKTRGLTCIPVAATIKGYRIEANAAVYAIFRQEPQIFAELLNDGFELHVQALANLGSRRSVKKWHSHDAIQYIATLTGLTPPGPAFYLEAATYMLDTQLNDAFRIFANSLVWGVDPIALAPFYPQITKSQKELATLNANQQQWLQSCAIAFVRNSTSNKKPNKAPRTC